MFEEACKAKMSEYESKLDGKRLFLIKAMKLMIDMEVRNVIVIDAWNIINLILYANYILFKNKKINKF